MQKISPDGKAKVQLQIVLHDGNNSTFHFVNKNGAPKQIQDRERVKELIQSILPNFKPKVDSELERKNKVLTDNPRLLQLYKDLVISKVLKESFKLNLFNYYFRRFLHLKNFGRFMKKSLHNQSTVQLNRKLEYLDLFYQKLSLFQMVAMASNII